MDVVHSPSVLSSPNFAQGTIKTLPGPGQMRLRSVHRLIIWRLWKPYSGKNHWAKSQECTVWQCCEMDDFKASSVVIWGTAVSHVDPPWLWFQMTWNLLQYWDEIGCVALRVYFLWQYLHGAYSSGQHGWLVTMVGGSDWANQQAAIPFTDSFGTSWIKFDVP